MSSTLSVHSQSSGVLGGLLVFILARLPRFVPRLSGRADGAGCLHHRLPGASDLFLSWGWVGGCRLGFPLRERAAAARRAEGGEGAGFCVPAQEVQLVLVL